MNDSIVLLCALFFSPLIVAAYPFDHNQPPPFEMIKLFCEDLDAFLKANSRNVAAVHSKKGRVG